MTVPLTNLFSNSAAFSAGAGDRHLYLPARRHFRDQPPASPEPSRRLKSHSNPISRPAQFNELYPTCSGLRLAVLYEFVPRNTLDTMLFVILAQANLGGIDVGLGIALPDDSASEFGSRLQRQYNFVHIVCGDVDFLAGEVFLFPSFGRGASVYAPGGEPGRSRSCHSGRS